MNLQSIKPHKQWLVLAAVLLTAIGTFVARTAFAGIQVNTISPQAIVTDNGRHLIVTGPIKSNNPGERCFLRVTVTQRSTGAQAEGSVAFDCSGAVEQWEVHAATQGNAAFQPGPATAVAVARTTVRGNATDAHQWLVNITLVSQ